MPTKEGSAEIIYFSATQVNKVEGDVTIPSLENGYLEVCIQTYDGAPSRTPDVSSVTAEGESLSKIREDENASGNLEYLVEKWGLKNPPTGAGVTITVNFAATNVTQACVTVTWMSGVDQTNPVNTHGGATGSTDPSVQITTTVDDCLVIASYCSEANDVLTPDAGLTALESHDWGAQVCGSGYGAVESAGNFTASFSGTDSAYAISAVAYAPAGGAEPLNVTPAAAGCVVTVTAPTVVLGSVTVTPATATAVASAAAPGVVYGSLSVIPAIARAVASAIAPLVHFGSTNATPGAASVWTHLINPSVLAGGEEERRIPPWVRLFFRNRGR